MAAFWVGAAYVPIDPVQPEERLRAMLEDCAPKLVLVHDGTGHDGTADVPTGRGRPPGASPPC
ncbi:hypothetical protein GXW82_31375 [Streptacidiphilus sp. 4-A2]|nr:hypothetical protein [Streptacidiphilus sp. 4-A2]